MSPTTAGMPSVPQLRELLKKGQAPFLCDVCGIEAKASGKSLGLEKCRGFPVISS